jgi:hypothetical protein
MSLQNTSEFLKHCHSGVCTVVCLAHDMQKKNKEHEDVKLQYIWANGRCKMGWMYIHGTIIGWSRPKQNPWF